jgi:hypothetical protein
MHPGQRLSYSLVISLALWWPTLQGTLRGDVDTLDASLRWVLAFAVATAGVRLLGGLVDRYADEQHAIDIDRGAASTADEDEVATA